MVTIQLQGNKRWSSRAGVRPARTETQILDDAWAQSSTRPNRVGGEAIAKGFGHHRTTHDGAALEDQNLFALFGEIRRSDQSIVPRADDDGVVLIGHELFLRSNFN